MDLKDFVAATLGQILEGVSAVQQTDVGKNVNAAFPGVLGSNLSYLENYGTFARVDFDVAVTADAGGSGKGSVRVLDFFQVEAGAEKRTQSVSRVSFAVPLRLPDGDQKAWLEEQAERARKRAAYDRAAAATDRGWMAT